MKKLVLAILLTSTSLSCAGLKRTTTGQWIGTAKPIQNPSVILLRVPNVAQDSGGMTNALRDALIRHGVKVFVEEVGLLAPEKDLRLEYVYILKGELTEWEDNPTAWSGNPDKATLSLELYDSTTKELLATATHRVVGPHLVLVSNSPAEFIPELADHALAKIFGWVSRVYHAD